MSNTVAVMREGRISQMGRPYEIYMHPANTFVADFVGSTNLVPGVVESRDGDSWLVRTEDGPLLVGQAVDVRESDPCLVSIRPEHVEIRADSSSTPQSNVVDGEVGARLFTGESMQYQVNLAHRRLTCRTSAGHRLSTGKPVTLHLPAARCTALPRRASPGR